MFTRELFDKVELIENLEDGEITFCDHDSFTDLCRGGHIPNTGFIKAVKLMSVAGAYWRGDENNPQLTRVYGISFPKQKELKEYLELLEEAKKRDHRKLGKELELFTFSQKVGQGLPLWLPKGAALRERLENFLKKAQKKAGYEQVVSPHIGQKELYVTSGHYAKYGEDSFQPIRTPKMDEEFLLKPMNCPHHCEIYNSRPWSYKELPKRYAEFGTVYRYEQSGELHGLTRVRGFTQDDAHIFCTENQITQECIEVTNLILGIYKDFGFSDIKINYADKPKKRVGGDKIWDKSEEALLKAVRKTGVKYTINKGEGAFYGPKIDFILKDAINREWQCGTVQVDFNLPERLNANYVDEKGTKQKPVLIHRALFGSLERFLGILIEHFGGDFPLWLAPVQAIILNITDKQTEYVQNIENLMKSKGFRVISDLRNEKIGFKIREHTIMRVPFLIVVGNREMESNVVSVRTRSGRDMGSMSLDRLMEKFSISIADRSVFITED